MRPAGKRIITIFVMLLLIATVVFIAVKYINNGPSDEKSGEVHINEVMSRNSGYIPDSNGEYFDWIELYNSASVDADISGYGLSDSITSNRGVEFVFPSGSVIKANSFIIVYCAGDTSKGALYTDFKLTSTDQCILYDNKGTPIDTIQLKTVETGFSLAKKELGDNWEQSEPTPGFPNTEQGLLDYQTFISENQTDSKQQLDAKGPIVINEFMASNLSTIADNSGGYFDWIELYNISDKDVSLTGYGISDSISDLGKYVFTDNIVLKSHEYLLIFCSGDSGLIDGQMHIPFGLRAYKEDVALSDTENNCIDYVTYSQLEADKSYARTPDGTGDFMISSSPTPGYPNSGEGYTAFIQNDKANLSNLYISEVMGANTSLLQAEGSFYDWIELFNPTDSSVKLSDYYLTDTAKNPAKWQFPDITVGSHEFLCVLASGGGKSGEENKIAGLLQTNFKISSDGEVIFLYDKNARLISKLGSESFSTIYSVGRNSDGFLRYYTEPTPNETNSSTEYLGISQPPTFVTTPGIYDSSVKVELKAASNSRIYYTTDCTTPTESSTEYKEPFSISENTVVTAISIANDYVSNFALAAGTFLFKSDEVNHSLPIISISTAPNNLWDGETGIYAYGNNWSPNNGDTWPYWQTPTNFWQEWEVPCVFEVFDDDGQQVFSQNVGLEITGSFGRGREQKGLCVTARDEYGKDRMNYRFFDDLPYTEYKSILLRCGGQDQANGKIRDELCVGILKGYDVNFLYQNYKPYVLYLNGRYWGLYFMREKKGRFFVAQHENLESADNMDLIKSETRANYGTTENWKSLMEYVRTHDLTVDSNYQYIADNIDLDSFTDYLICEIYVANTDYWNMQMYRTEGGKWRFVYYDFCWGFDYTEHNTLKARRDAAQPGSDLFNALLKRSDYREKFLRRFAELLNTVFDTDHVLGIIDELNACAELEVKRERQLFNSSASPYFDYVDPHNISTYERYVEAIKYMRSFAQNRKAVVLRQIQSEFSLSEDYMKEVFSVG